MPVSEIAAVGQQDPPAGRAGAGGTAALTDEQIIGLQSTGGQGLQSTGGQGLEPSEPTQAEPAQGEQAGVPAPPEKPPESVAGQAPAPEASKVLAAEEIPQDGRTIPAELRDALKANPALRDAWFRQQAYAEIFPTVAEARAFREQFPGGLEDAKKLLEEVQEVSELDQLYYGGTPEGHRQLVEGLQTDDPKSFNALVPIAVEKWAAVDPEGYSRTLGAIVGQTFAQNRLPEHVEAIRAQLEQGNAEEAGKLAEELAAWVNGFLPGRQERVDPREAAFRRREEELNRRDTEIKERQQREFFDGYLGEVSEKATGAIKEFVNGVVPAEISEGARNRIVGDIFNEINRSLGQNRAFMGERDRLLRGMDRGKAVEYVLARAKQLLPAVGRKVLSEWTGTILAANKKQVEAKRAAATKVDVGAGGAPEARPKKPLTKKDVDYSKMSDEDILSM